MSSSDLYAAIPPPTTSKIRALDSGVAVIDRSPRC
jgi:hypothetical protein